ncbi:putative peptidase S1, PA clan [Medicago truncatula]|uniref:Putative peptidase S1, PA clan n=1 Tax=Medicago truncatula TaxID=3880 RepID=G7KBA9_MEDTR|nr:trypsin-like peptidase domain protein [Medicago truncatula]RHN56148.1 putative peptidase S1, PA clan [Medicago truncatula]
MRLSENGNKFTYLIKVCHEVDDKYVVTNATGFAIDIDYYAKKFEVKNPLKENDLVLVTCAHALNDKSNATIEVRRLEDQEFISELEVPFIKLSWDIALLVVKGAAKGANCDRFGELADDGSIANCETLLQLGHLGDLVWSVFIGRAAYPCVKSFKPSGRDESEPFGRATCGGYVSNSLKTTPTYRILGDMWNANYFATHKEKKFMFQKKLRASIPIIQCVGFSCTDDACSGGPVLNTQGKIVGMIVGQSNDCQIAIHVTVLEKFLKNNLIAAQEVDEKEKQPQGGGHSSKDAKRGKKKELIDKDPPK